MEADTDPFCERGAIMGAMVSDRDARRLHDALLHLHEVTPRVLVEADG